MIEVKMLDWSPNDSIEVVRELRQKGYIQGVDFDFEYHKPKFSETTYEAVHNRFVLFQFHKEELATWFQLKYG